MYASLTLFSVVVLLRQTYMPMSNMILWCSSVTDRHICTQVSSFCFLVVPVVQWTDTVITLVSDCSYKLHSKTAFSDCCSTMGTYAQYYVLWLFQYDRQTHLFSDCSSVTDKQAHKSNGVYVPECFNTQLFAWCSSNSVFWLFLYQVCPLDCSSNSTLWLFQY